MKKEIIRSLTKDFESHANKTKNKIEFWFARDLQHLLGYQEWRNFNKVIDKAKTACEISGQKIKNHLICRLFFLYIKNNTQKKACLLVIPLLSLLKDAMKEATFLLQKTTTED